MVKRSGALLLALVAGLAVGSSADAAKSARASRAATPAVCHDARTGKAMDCVPATFDTFDIPSARLPGGRVNARGELDPKSSPADAHKGAFVAAKKLGLFRNFVWLHWVPTAPSKKDLKTGEWSGGDL